MLFSCFVLNGIAKHIVYSSFDIRVVTALTKRGLKHWILFDKYTKLMNKQPHICVDIQILDKIMKQIKKHYQSICILQILDTLS